MPQPRPVAEGRNPVSVDETSVRLVLNALWEGGPGGLRDRTRAELQKTLAAYRD